MLTALITLVFELGVKLIGDFVVTDTPLSIISKMLLISEITYSDSEVVPAGKAVFCVIAI